MYLRRSLNKKEERMESHRLSTRKAAKPQAPRVLNPIATALAALTVLLIESQSIKVTC